jgi:hypothetical protein
MSSRYGLFSIHVLVDDPLEDTNPADVDPRKKLTFVSFVSVHHGLG